MELAIPGSAVRHTSVARQLTDCATWPGNIYTSDHSKYIALNQKEESISAKRVIADFIGLLYFYGFPSGLKSHVLISHDFLSQSKFVLLPQDQAAICSRPASKHQKKYCFVSKQACIYCIGSEDQL